ncbi:MAG: sulfite oxidase-like oxidoreductase [Actinomycetota bacterium]|nr:sulfite oxidase-like oxidoreductase [Actinomycetota bacterium]
MKLGRTPDEKVRTPPGQRLTRGWPVLHAETIPPFDESTWRFRVFGLVANPFELSWSAFKGLPTVDLTSDIHCVTGWSKLDNRWEGVAFTEIAARAQPLPAVTHVVTHAPSGYTANVPLDVVMDDDVLFAWSHDGEPLQPKHGGPLRLVIPKRYFWKSVKWADGVEFLDHDERGFWEVRGYHNDAHPFAEERFSWQER